MVPCRVRRCRTRADRSAARRIEPAIPRGPMRTTKSRSAVAKRTSKTPRKTAAKVKPKAQSRKNSKPKLLSGGNPQVAKGDGDAPVQAYIAAIPGWKRDI